jgi:peptidoglycan L-alanyl-D-glutamate endopeptidase CwlK
MADKISHERIALLHPKVRDEAEKILTEVEAHLQGKAAIRITQGLRTIQEQDVLYAQGRTKPGKVVTNARGGSSYHNYGLAIDFTLLVNGQISWDMKTDWDGDKVADWMEVVNIFKKYGWEWGGNWKSLKDYPHFQKTFGYSISDLRIKYNKKDFIKGSNVYLNL